MLNYNNVIQFQNNENIYSTIQYLIYISFFRSNLKEAQISLIHFVKLFFCEFELCYWAGLYACAADCGSTTRIIILLVLPLGGHI